MGLPPLFLKGSTFTTAVPKDCGSGLEPLRAAATGSTWESNVGEEHLTEKAINLKVYSQRSCWCTATDHLCQTNPTQRMMGPGPGLLTPCFPWKKLPRSKVEPPGERGRERGFFPHPCSLPPYQNPRHSLEGSGPLGMTPPGFRAKGSEFPGSWGSLMLRSPLLGSP